jgi:hypothetical protein
MSRHNLFAYVDGYDLQDLADEVEVSCEEFVAAARVFNRRLEVRKGTLERPARVGTRNQRRSP